MGAATSTIIGVVTALASASMGVYGAVQQSQSQKAQAEYQSDMAQYNATVAEQQALMAEEEGKAIKQQSYEDSLKKRQEASLIVGKQRAAQAASGAAVDTGSALDTNLDTVERGEIDAFHAKEAGAWQNYDKQVEAWNYRNSAAQSQSQSQMYDNKAQSISPFFEGTQSALAGAKKVNTTLDKLDS